MYNDFVNSFEKIMKEAAYTKINLPPDFPFAETSINLWGREQGGQALFYITYDTKSVDWGSFHRLKGYMADCIATVTERISVRHAIAFNIFVGDIGTSAAAYINSTTEYALMPQYDLFFGVDAHGVRHSHLAPVHMDKALTKIQMAVGHKMQAVGRPLTAPPKVRRTYATPASIPVGQQYAAQARPVTKYPIFAIAFIAINVIMFIVLEATGGSTNGLNLLRWGAAYYPAVFGNGVIISLQPFIFIENEYHRLITPIFLHNGFMHLAMNSIWLVLAGIRANTFYGHIKFLVIYLVSGVVGSIAMMLITPGSIGVGASGAIFGLMGALLAYMLVSKQNIETFTLQTLGIMVGLNLVFGFIFPEISNSAHIGGLVTGFALGWIFTKLKMRKSR